MAVKPVYLTLFATTIAFPVSWAGQCTPPAGYEPDFGKYYKFYPNKWEYKDAKDTCEGDGARLAVMKTQDDDDALRMFLEGEANNGYFWVGLTKLFTEAECKDDDCDFFLKWSDGSDFVHNFDVGIEVKGSTKEGNCFKYTGQRIIDDICTKNRKFLCQFDCSTTPVPASLHSDNCILEKDVEYEKFKVGSIGPQKDVAGCQQYCKGIGNEAKYFTVSASGGCQCKSSTAKAIANVGFESGEVDCAGKCGVWNRVDLDGHDVGSVATDVNDVPDCQLYCGSNNAPFFTLKPNGCYCKASKSGARPETGYISGEACGGSGMLVCSGFTN